MTMLMNDRNSADRLKVQKMLFSLWMALAAIMVILTMAAGLATSSHASEAVDPMTIDPLTTSAIASAPISKASDRIFVTGLVVLGFGTMAVGGTLLTLSSIRESRLRRNRD